MSRSRSSTTRRATHALGLRAFSADWAQRVAGWVATPQDALWLAPRDTPPITPDSILAWGGAQRRQWLVFDGPTPVAYGELNVLDRVRRQYWLGHLLVDPAQRGQGYGRKLTQLLLERAFERNFARKVTLVVFPENYGAIAAYRAAGMREDGYEVHRFPVYNLELPLLRFVATQAW